MIIKYIYEHKDKSNENKVLGFRFELDTEKNFFKYKHLAIKDVIQDEILDELGIPCPSYTFKCIKLSDCICKAIEDISTTFQLAFEIAGNYTQDEEDYDESQGYFYESMTVKIPEYELNIRFERQKNTTLNNLTENSMHIFESCLSELLLKEEIEFTLNKLVVKGEILP